MEDARSDPMRARSIAELEGLHVEKGAYELGSQAWLSRALVSPIGQLGVPDLRLLVSHGRGLRHLMPIVLETLERTPFAAGDHGRGDLLTVTCLVDDAYWADHPDERTRLLAVLRAASTQLDTLPDEERERWREELAAAGERFGS
jgi:hypothetical protein